MTQIQLRGPHIMISVRSAFTSLFACVLSLSLVGCTLANTAAPDAISGTAIAGNLHGGQQAITGAKVYLLAANPTAYGSASVSLLTTALTGNAVDTIGAYGTSTSTGAFDITGDYSCTTGYAQGATTASGGITLPGNQQVYLYAVGGNPGLGTGVNTNIGLLAALGPCNAQFSQTLQVNEITTVAAAYALAGYATDALHLSSGGSALALTGLTNAGLNSKNLAVVSSGTPPVTTAGSNGIVPTGNIITIANILASCINGPTASSNCFTLFQYTKTLGANGTAATDTATAAIYLAHNPYPTAAGMTALYGLASSTPPFAGNLTTQPHDFTLGINFSNNGCFNNASHGLAIDASGSAWSLGGHGLCKFSSTGTPATNTGSNGFQGGGFLFGLNLAIDNSGNVWIPDFSTNVLTKFSNSGTALSGTGFTGGGISTPRDVAIDASGNVWIANQPGTVSKFSSGGTAISTTSGYSDGGSNEFFYGIAIDTVGSVWAVSYNGGLSKFANSGPALSPSAGFSGGGMSNPYDVAIDGSGNVWTANYGADTLSKFSNAGTAISSNGGYIGGGLSSPEGIAIDSAGNAWVADENTSSVSVFTSSGTGLTPYPAYNAGSGIYTPTAIALDGSGDVWVTNGNGSLTELIGASAPVVTPLAANLVTPYGTATVNRP
jgi:streptogramin lyase